MNVSVVIPTHDRAELLRLSIPALVNQAAQGISYEVHFVQDGPEDASARLIEEAARAYPGLICHHVIPHSGGPSAPRNHGIRQAVGSVLVLLDDDIVPDADLVQQHWQFHQDHADQRAVAIGELYMTPEVRRDPMSLFFDFPYHELREKGDLGFLFFWSGNISMRREFMLNDGMFLDDGTLSLLEDMECGYRLSKRGMKLSFHAKARGCHIHDLKPEAVPVKGYNTGRAQYALALKIPDRALKERFGILSTELPGRMLLQRVFRRLAFHLLDNPATAALLRRLGAEGSERTRITDLYYYLIFRRNMLAGYNATRRQSPVKSGALKDRLEKGVGV